MDLPVTLMTAGAVGALLVVLASRVSQLRIQRKVAFGDGGDPALMRAIRAHGNTTEHAPIFLVMLLACELALGTGVYLAVLGGAFVLARLAFAAGVLGRGMHLWRQAGAALTYLLQLLIAGTAVWAALA